MRKLITILLTVLLALSCTAFAEADSELVEFDFGDFTMDVYGDMIYDDDYDFEENMPFFYLYDNYDANKIFNPNLNIVWSSVVFDPADLNPADYAAQVMNGSVAVLEQQGLIVSNPVVLYADTCEQDGKDGISIMVQMTLDLSGLGINQTVEQYTLQGVCSDPAFGAYYFTITTDNLENAARLMNVMDSIDWAD